MKAMTASTSWLTCPQPRHDARLRLFCFPFAGGGASTYRLWGTRLSQAVEVCPLQLPGREERAGETPYTNMVRLAVAAANEMAALLDRPFALFGHGMGALVAFEVARALRRAQRPSPSALLVSTCCPPQSAADCRTLIGQLPDAAFSEHVVRLNALPDAVLRDPQQLARLLPTVRADFEACDTYEYAVERPLDCPVSAFGARNDRVATEAHLGGWRAQTSGAFEQLTLPGDRFFIHTHPDALLAHIGSRLRRLAGGRSEPGPVRS
jgi:medium-chain acyl-[acyl-carrier-protein] hydrolase